MLNVKQEAVNTNFQVIGLTQLGIKPKSTAPKVNALTTPPSELFSKPRFSFSKKNLQKKLSFFNYELLKIRASKEICILLASKP